VVILLVRRRWDARVLAGVVDGAGRGCWVEVLRVGWLSAPVGGCADCGLCVWDGDGVGDGDGAGALSVAAS
jgi:hypothetical protein